VEIATTVASVGLRSSAALKRRYRNNLHPTIPSAGIMTAHCSKLAGDAVDVCQCVRAKFVR
jgi:hypothetical protein